MVFDGRKPTGGDLDLGLSHRGKILILSTDGNSNNPNDSRHGGYFYFKFDHGVRMESIILIDNEYGVTITLKDKNNKVLKSIHKSGRGDKSEEYVNLGGVTNVYKMHVTLKTSGAIDNIVYSIPCGLTKVKNEVHSMTQKSSDARKTMSAQEKSGEKKYSDSTRQVKDWKKKRVKKTVDELQEEYNGIAKVCKNKRRRRLVFEVEERKEDIELYRELYTDRRSLGSKSIAQLVQSRKITCSTADKLYAELSSSTLSTLTDELIAGESNVNDTYKSTLSQVLSAYFKKEKEVNKLLKQLPNLEKTYPGTTGIKQTFDSLENELKGELNKLKRARKLVQKLLQILGNIVFRNFCLDFVGASGYIVTQADMNTFRKETTSVLELAAANQGFDFDVISVNLLKQELVDTRRGRSLQEGGENDTADTSRILGTKREEIRLRVATIVGLICNCEEEDPVSDIWDSLFGGNRALLGGNNTQRELQADFFGRDIVNEFVKLLTELLTKSAFTNLVAVELVPCNGFAD
eukprot:CAMPEP_0118685680 /NCGR_PEP_ID=MMETSP0800-20121206/7386_1 /TAXON_ID=210618 ORGANISM="Striatella unipunctata, Strain CCMP2910" /NCGR_SAMPLE_ID=MMETSP0800 /ASSEMBLY_ACC=CAM_ASM_000638 /LENGTH=518 /DNA_ID=CAMNT_0006582629 /DNA_START=314 /DNA_END=1870 /DNA_ORIENTATION=+